MKNNKKNPNQLKKNTAYYLNSFEICIIRSIKDLAHHDLNKLYDLYDESFTLPEEKEPINSFYAILKLNKSKKYREKFGRFEETIIYLKDIKTGTIVGAICFATYEMPKKVLKKHKIHALCFLIYAFVKKEYRSMGLGKKLIEMTVDYSTAFAKNKKKKKINLLSFGELNNPLLMTADEYLTDTEHAGMDQCDRLKLWDSIGLKPLDFKYIQPPLTPDKNPCGYLSLYTISGQRKYIDNELLIELLKRFFSLSVFKGKDIENNPYWKNQLKELQKRKKTKIKKINFERIKSKVAPILEKARNQKELKKKPLGKII